MSKGWLITGVSTGFGLELAKAALAKGHRVAGTLRQAGQIAGFEALAPGRTKGVLLDVTDAPAVPAAVEAASTWLGGVDVLINNAGSNQVGAFEELSQAEFRRAMEINFFGATLMIRAVLPEMRARGRGDIINFSSSAGVIGLPGLSAYSAAKFALGGFTEALGKELVPFGIRVMVVEPGSFRTNFRAGRATAENPIAAYDNTPAGRMRAAMSAGQGQQPGDPVKLARVLVDMLEGKELPVHFTAGTDALALFEKKHADDRASFDRWRIFGAGLDVV